MFHWGSLGELLDALHSAAEKCDEAAINHGDSEHAIAHWKRVAVILRDAHEKIEKSPRQRP